MTTMWDIDVGHVGHVGRRIERAAEIMKNSLYAWDPTDDVCNYYIYLAPWAAGGTVGS